MVPELVEGEAAPASTGSGFDRLSLRLPRYFLTHTTRVAAISRIGYWRTGALATGAVVRPSATSLIVA